MAPPTGAPLKPGAKKKIPTVYFVAGAAGLVVVYYLWKKSKAAGAAAGAVPAAATATAPVAAGSYGLQPYLGQMAGTSSPGSTATGPASFPNTVSNAAGDTFLPTQANYAQLSASGLANQVYYQAPGSPGIFLPVTYDVASKGLATGMPLFLRTSNQGQAIPAATPTGQ